MSTITNDSLVSFIHVPRNDTGTFGSYRGISIHMLELQLIMNALMKYIPPVLLAVGTPANILLFSVLRRESFRDVSAYFYIQTFSVVNILSLYLGCGADWISYVSNRPSIEITSDISCRFWMFLLSVITYSVVWIVVGMAVDRYVYIWHSRKANSLCTVFFAKVGVIIIMTGLVVISVNAMWTFELKIDMRGTHSVACFIPQRYNDVFSLAWPWVSASFYLMIPLTLVFVLTLLIVIGLCFRRQPSASRHGQFCDNRGSVTAVLLVCLEFFTLAAPMTVMTLFEFNIPSDWRYNSVLVQRVHFLQTIFRYMAAANNVTCSLTVLLCVSVLRRTAWQIITETLARCRTSIKRTEWQKVDMHGDRDPKTSESCSMTTPL